MRSFGYCDCGGSRGSWRLLLGPVGRTGPVRPTLRLLSGEWVDGLGIWLVDYGGWRVAVGVWGE